DRRCLLVLDNLAEGLTFREWCPTTGTCRVIITSRNQSLASLGTVVQVGVFDTETATSFLLERTSRTDHEGAQAVAMSLGGLPLALGHAAALCRTIPFSEYLHLL